MNKVSGLATFICVQMVLVGLVGSHSDLAVAQDSASRSSSLSFNRSKLALPKATGLDVPKAQPHDFRSVKPPRSSEFYEGDSKQAEYERLLDEEIKKLFELSQQYRRSANRGELWLRLAERYVEKAKLVNLREQAVYDQKVKDFNDKKTKIRPHLNEHDSHEYNKKAMVLYEWFIKEFPKDPKIDQAFFFLGYNYFELGDSAKGELYYRRLVKQFPNSLYIYESYFALGEYYFDKEKWQLALDAYSKVISRKRSRLNIFALYKSAWCLYRLNRSLAGLKALERVVKLSGGGDDSDKVEGAKSVNRVRLGSEALHDYVQFYAETGQYADALESFQRVSQDDKRAHKMLEQLAYVYFDNGNRAAAANLFRQLISENPKSEKASEYQYRIVLTVVTSDPRLFRKELVVWMDSFGPKSQWAEANAKDKKLLADTAALQETTLRNYVLQLHQTAQNSHAEFSQQAANSAYALYFKSFPNSPQLVEMVFFRAELLFDMNKYEEASKLYTYVADKEPTGKYYEKAVINNVLALEKDLPSTKEIEDKRGKSIEPLPLDPAGQRFEKGANRYLAAFPKGDKVSDILRRLGVLYYSYNQFDKAMEVFSRVLRDYPDTPNAEIAGNLILDMYKLRGDMVGLSNKGQELLKNPKIAKSKFGDDIRNLLEKANYLKADKLSQNGDALKAAREFEKFSESYKQSDLALAARYKAASAYEKAGDVASALRMHKMVLAVSSKDPKVIQVQKDSTNDLARLYQQTGQLEAAASQYQAYAKVVNNEQKANNAYYNAAVLLDGLNRYNEAYVNYDRYFQGSRKSDRFEVLYAQAEILRRQNALGRASSTFEKYLQSPVNDKEHIAKATWFVAKHAESLHQKTKSEEWFKKIIDLNRRFKALGSDAATGYAAEVSFKQTQSTIEQIRHIKFYKNEKQQATAAKDLESLKNKYISQMKEIIRFDNAPMIVAALASTGQMFELLAKIYSELPTPSGYSADDAKKLQDLMAGKVKELRDEAKNSYKSAYDRALELETYGDWTTVAAQGLAAYDSSIATGEQTSTVKSLDWMGL